MIGGTEILINVEIMIETIGIEEIIGVEITMVERVKGQGTIEKVTPRWSISTVLVRTIPVVNVHRINLVGMQCFIMVVILHWR